MRYTKIIIYNSILEQTVNEDCKDFEWSFNCTDAHHGTHMTINNTYKGHNVM